MSLPKIHVVLYANASFCLASALLILLLPGILANYLIDLPLIVFRILGVGLLLFAVDVFFTARNSSPSYGKLLYIFGADLAWVVLTPVVMLLLQDRITSLGNLVLVDVALIVAVFAVGEWLAMRRMGAESSL